MDIQKFNPDHMLVSDYVGKEILASDFTGSFKEEFMKYSALIKLGKQREMGNQNIVKVNASELVLPDAYFVGEGQKIKTSRLKLEGGYLENVKVAVILPITNEAKSRTWSDYFTDALPAIGKAFASKIDSALIAGGPDNPFGRSILSSATVINGDITADNILDLEYNVDPSNAFLGTRETTRKLLPLKAIPQPGETPIEFVKPVDGTGTLDGMPYVEIKTASGIDIPVGTLISGNFDNLLYGIRNDADLRIMVGDQATLSTMKNVSPDTGDVNLFEQDSLACRYVFELGVFFPEKGNFAVLQPKAVVPGP